jgi:zinc transporter ZupT
VAASGPSTTSWLLIIALALVHVLGGRLGLLEKIPHRRWISLAGGTSIAYVFIDLLPRLETLQGVIARQDHPLLQYLENHAYIMALAGLVLFYGIEHAARVSGWSARSPETEDASETEDDSEMRWFWVHMALYSIYYGAIGYLFHYEAEQETSQFLAFAVAMALHFVVIDHSLRDHHPEDYDRVGRWILAGAVLVGWGLGLVAPIPEGWLAAGYAFLAGAIMLIVLKEELPQERESRFWPFVIGVAGYTALLLITQA